MVTKKELLEHLNVCQGTLQEAKKLKSKIQDRNVSDTMGYLHTSIAQLAAALRKIVEDYK